MGSSEFPGSPFYLNKMMLPTHIQLFNPLLPHLHNFTRIVSEDDEGGL